MPKDVNISDQVLVAALKKSNHQAFDQLFHKYGTKLYTFTLSILKDEYEAEETVQNIFCKIWEKRKDMNPSLSFKSYLYTIALNATKKIYREKSQKEKYKQKIAIEINLDQSSDLSAIEYKNLLDYVDTIINRLPPSCRQIFIMSRKNEMKNVEIAKSLNISEQTVKNQLVKAQRFLKDEALKKHDELGFLLFILFFT